MVCDLDDLDIEILKKAYFLRDGESQKIWDWTIDLFPLETSDLERKKNYIKIKRRIRKMRELFSTEKNGVQNFVLNADKVLFQKKKLPNGMKDCILVNEGGFWNVFQISH